MRSFKNRDIISLKDFDRQEIEHIFEVSERMEPIFKEKKRVDLLKNKILATCFFEPSTRTRLSFESAMLRLGGGVTGFADAKVTRAADWRAEPLDDTFRMIENYADVIVVRHPMAGAAKLVADCVNIPVINAGDGGNEHPTQAFLDMYTIKKNKGSIDGLEIALVGDLKHERTFHSLAYGLSNFNVKLALVYPEGYGLPVDNMKALREKGIAFKETQDLEDVIRDVDVIYTDIIRKEEFKDSLVYERLHASYYHFTLETLREAKEGLILLQPLPRTDGIDYQISPELDGTKHAKYFDQARYGVVVRMALLASVLGAVD